jgi:hypothetical protein
MAGQPVNLSTAIYLGVFSRPDQLVLQAIFKAIAEGGGRCVATLAMLARNSNTSKSTTRNAIAQAVTIGLKRPSIALTAQSRFPTFWAAGSADGSVRRQTLNGRTVWVRLAKRSKTHRCFVPGGLALVFGRLHEPTGWYGAEVVSQDSKSRRW